MAEYPKAPCTQIVYTLALKQSLCWYFGAKVYTIYFLGTWTLIGVVRTPTGLLKAS